MRPAGLHLPIPALNHWLTSPKIKKVIYQNTKSTSFERDNLNSRRRRPFTTRRLRRHSDAVRSVWREVLNEVGVPRWGDGDTEHQITRDFCDVELVAFNRLLGGLWRVPRQPDGNVRYGPTVEIQWLLGY